MPGGLRVQPKVFRGAFVELGLGFPPLSVLFQYNPLQLSRSRSLTFSMPGVPQEEEHEGGLTLRDFHQRFDTLNDLRDAQHVTVAPESLSFEIRLDATDSLNEGDEIAERYGIAPQLATLELMTLPKSNDIAGALLNNGLLPGGLSFTGAEKPPIVLFVWGRKRILPVNINSLQVTETEFTPDLDPIRATVSVNLTIIEGSTDAAIYSRSRIERLAKLNRARLKLTDVMDIVIPR